MSTATEIELVPGSVDRDPGASLVQAMREERAILYDGLDLDAPDMPKAGPQELGSPGGTLLVGYRDGEPICCGGVKRLDERACEIKRMYVGPAHRGRGVARRLLAALEQTARELGYTVARLDTGDRQPGAQRLYRSLGYVEIANFNGNPLATFFGEKELA